MPHARKTSKPAIIGRVLAYALIALTAGVLGSLISPHAAVACGLLAVAAVGVDVQHTLNRRRRSEP